MGFFFGRREKEKKRLTLVISEMVKNRLSTAKTQTNYETETNHDKVKLSKKKKCLCCRKRLYYGTKVSYMEGEACSLLPDPVRYHDDTIILIPVHMWLSNKSLFLPCLITPSGTTNKEKKRLVTKPQTTSRKQAETQRSPSGVDSEGPFSSFYRFH